MPGLAATGTLTYNGYTFDGATKIDVAVEFVLEEAGRSVKFHKHTITVNAIVANDGTSGDLDNDLLAIRRRLGEAGKGLVFRQKGFGNDLVIGGAKKDVKNGPTPSMLSWLPLGDDKAAEVVWQVVVSVPVCLGRTAQNTGIMSINWGATYDIDQRGATTRTLAGHIEIASSGGRNGVGQDTADRYRGAFAPKAIKGFTRRQQWSISTDKSRCDFQIVDTELASPNPYPPGTTAIDCRHRLSWNRSKPAQVSHTLSATISPMAKVSPALAWSIFQTIFVNRAFRQITASSSLFLENIDIDEDLFNRPQSFRVSWRHLSSPSEILSDIRGQAGMWEKLPTRWDEWSGSLVDSTFHIRGNAGLADRPQDDAIIDLCVGGRTDIKPNNLTRGNREFSVRSGFLSNSTPPEEKSFLEYDLFLEVRRVCPYAQQSIIQKPDKDAGAYNYDDSGTVPDRGPVFTNSEAEFIDDIIQQGGAYRYEATLSGRAKRAGHRIPRPTLKKVGSRDATEIESKFIEKNPEDHLGVLVHEAAWVVRFGLTGAPDAVNGPTPRQSGISRRGRKITTRTPGRPTNADGSTNTFQMF